MAVNPNIGKITAAIIEGRNAFKAMDFSPVMPSQISSIDPMAADWGTETINPNIFIAGIHKWGDTTLRVTK